MFTLKRGSAIVLGVLGGIGLALLIAILALLTMLVYRLGELDDVIVAREVITTREVTVTRVVDVTSTPPDEAPVTEPEFGPAVYLLLDGYPLNDPAMVEAIVSGVPWQSVASDLLGPDGRFVVVWRNSSEGAELRDTSEVEFDRGRGISLVQEIDLSEINQFAVLVPPDDPALMETGQVIAELVFDLFAEAGAEIPVPVVDTEARVGLPTIVLSREGF